MPIFLNEGLGIEPIMILEGEEKGGNTAIARKY